MRSRRNRSDAPSTATASADRSIYIDGVARGDAVKLTEAFRPDARMYGAIGEQSYDMPSSDFIDHMTENPDHCQ